MIKGFGISDITLLYRRFAVEFANGTRANLSTYWTTDGTIEQFLLEPAD